MVFTGDNVFGRVKAFIKEANPWQWLESLAAIGALDIEVIVPGHGEPCDKRYLSEQAKIIQDWVGAVEGFISCGLTLENALKEQRPQVDPYPIDQRLFTLSDRLDQRIIINLYAQKHARGERSG